MKTYYISQDKYQTTDWSGGKTTQMYLSPEHSGEYKIGKFDYRISSATIDLDTSVFSKLPGYKRIILSLNNAIVLKHDDEIIPLDPFETHYFRGDINTISEGKCRDFNLIYREDYTGDIRLLEKGGNITLEALKQYIIYAIEDVSIMLNHYTINVTQGDSLVISQLDRPETMQWLSNSSKRAALLVEVQESLGG